MPNFFIYIEEEEGDDLEYVGQHYVDAPADEALDRVLEWTLIEHRERLAGRPLVVINAANMMTFDQSYTRRKN